MTIKINGTTGVEFPNASVQAKAADTGPAFSGVRIGNQSISVNTDTLVVFNSEDFDTANCFDIANGRFTPTVAGYYQININMDVAATGLITSSVTLRKTGGTYQILETLGSGVGARFSGSALVFMNGTTDYLDVTVYIGGTSGAVINGNARFSGFLARNA